VVALVPVACFPLFFELPAVVYLGVWFVLQFASGFFALTSGTNAEGIAWWAHVGGFLAGILLLRVFGVRRQRPADVATH
jgi:membrane associated rhomboid family serine protease